MARHRGLRLAALFLSAVVMAASIAGCTRQADSKNPGPSGEYPGQTWNSQAQSVPTADNPSSENRQPVFDGAVGSQYYSADTTFGLSCSKPCELLEEQIRFEEQGWDFLVEMTYRIKTDGPLELVLPLTESPKDAFFLMLDGTYITPTEHKLQGVRVGGNALDKGAGLQSVFYMPNAMTAYRQPATTYLDLFDRLYSYQPDVERWAGQMCWVYNVTNSQGYMDTTEETNFTVTGPVDQARFLLTSEQIKLNRYTVTDCSYDPELKNMEFHVQSYNRPVRRMLMVPQTGKQPEVVVFGQRIQPESMTVEQALQRYASESRKPELLSAVASYMELDAQEDPLIQLSSLNDHSYDLYYSPMLTAPVQTPGEHTVTVQYWISPGSTEVNRLLQWMGAPAVLWSRVGKRQVTVEAGGRQYQYEPGEKLLDIKLPREVKQP